MVEFKIEGLAELNALLQTLPAKIEAKVLRGGLYAAAKVIQDEAKRLCPVGPTSAENAQLYGGYPGALRDSIRISTSVKNGVVSAKIIAGNRKKNRKGAQVYYAHMVEYGTAAHWIKPKNKKSLAFGGMVRKMIKHPGTHAEPFMRPALDSKAYFSVHAAADYMRERLLNELIGNAVFPKA